MTVNGFKKKKDLLICVDSDGCAMDTMNIKHTECFGPCTVAEWELYQWREEVLSLWNRINLYTESRGINRFKALAKTLAETDRLYRKTEGTEEFIRWTENSPELSEAALRKKTEEDPDSVIFPKVLAWSIAVNKAVKELPQEKKKPFPKVKEALAFAGKKADVAAVSSANPEAVLEEWKEHGLTEFTDVILSQNDGSKEFCIGELIKKGYDRSKILMCGDSPGDMHAAEANGVYFYPILERKEKESWEEFISTAFVKLEDGSYGKGYGQAKKKEFLKNLGE